MIGNILKNIFGSKNEREIKKILPIVDEVNNLEPKIKAMSDEELRAQTDLFKDRLKNGETLDEILPEAFATVREASWRTLKMRHFDMQIVGGVVLHQGKIAEMKTGEGKTLVATLAVYLNALEGKGVHVVTVNDYLAKRDTEWMGQIYKFLGLSVGTIVQGIDEEERQEAYARDITYGTNNEFGFDYLRDNMKFYKEELVQRDFNFVIVDEVDSILVDESRTPLIISGPAEQSTGLYKQVNNIIPKLIPYGLSENSMEKLAEEGVPEKIINELRALITRDYRRQDDFERDLEQELGKDQTVQYKTIILKNAGKDYSVDEKARSAILTEQGVSHAEKLLKIDNLYDPKYIEILHHVNQALKAHALFKRDVDYVVRDGQVVIVDEFTGRLMPGRRYSDGLHQALEAKENVKVENENQTLASITFQNYFRMYDKLSGMTGTADTEAAEFKKIYNLDVMVIPTNNDMIRIDHPDVIYKTRDEKFKAAINEIKALHKKGQPVLVGTISIDVSEYLSEKLKRHGIKHSVLNAKNHKQEAEIISNAGQKGVVTISTNMAGRGTDIVLGDGVADLGGLHVLGTERHESRRIDNQLRGRSGRQGDQGSSKFYLSLEDDLLRIFGGDRITGIMDRFGMDEDEPIEHRFISKVIENAQRKVEGHNFDIRKHLIEYDDVMNQQREVIYKQRHEAMKGEDLKSSIKSMIREHAENIAAIFADDRLHPKEWDWNGCYNEIFKQFAFYRNMEDSDSLDGLTKEGLAEWIFETAIEIYSAKEKEIGEENFSSLEQMVLLQCVDKLWKDHLFNMDHLKEGIGLRGYAQQNPLIVYKKEGFEMFQNMISTIKEETIAFLFRIQLDDSAKTERMLKSEQQNLNFSHGDEPIKKKPVKRTEKKIGRNSPCPCGSGKKYKKCCGKNN
ncbi:Protein translocase subunit SecA [Candidatus Magnetomoraceae bacterium gMMP-1]